jgi:NTE family protein
MRVALVLGAGGVLGGAWLTGGLKAMAEETGWDPGAADRIVGTSAGAVVGGLVAAGVPPWFMVAHSAGESFDRLAGPDGRAAAEADRSGGGTFRLHRGLPPIGPGSLRLALSAAAHPFDGSALPRSLGWVPRGFISTDPIKDIVRRVVPEGWTDHPDFRAVACDYSNGQPVPFGAPGAPPAEMADAVAASCAIPGFYHPVSIGGRRYVDGGLHSTSNLDQAADGDFDLVICLNPTSSRDQHLVPGPAGRLSRMLRTNSGRRLGREARQVRASGAELVLIQPLAEDLELMGTNLMNGKRRHEVIMRAVDTVRTQIARPSMRSLLEELPAGEPHKVSRPEGDPSTWPEIVPSRAA